MFSEDIVSDQEVEESESVEEGSAVEEDKWQNHLESVQEISRLSKVESEPF